MRKIATILAFIMVSPCSFSEPSVPTSMGLDKIAFQISAKQWVTTDSALVGVAVSVTLDKADLVKARSDMMSSLNKIVQGHWHVLKFDRSQDSSGLEKLAVQAQLRVNESSLTAIYQKAKEVSKPGAQYIVESIEFKPSLEEIQAVRAAIRHTLYQQINDELKQMNSVYPQQNYTVNHLVFIEGDSPPIVPNYQDKTMNTMVMPGSSPVNLAVSNELVLTAVVEAASNRRLGN